MLCMDVHNVYAYISLEADIHTLMKVVVFDGVQGKYVHEVC